MKLLRCNPISWFDKSGVNRPMGTTCLIITVDTEEDQWGDYNCGNYSAENIKGVPWFQSICDNYSMRPTYLISYVVARDNFGIKLFKHLKRSGRCEIGAHCHPWNTPPFQEKRTAYNSMLCNLPEELQLLKLTKLKEAIEAGLEVAPTCFRAGRWGFDSSVARNLCKLSYVIDTSVTPYVSWTKYFGPDLNLAPDQPYFFSPDSPLRPETKTCESNVILEVPVSIGFRQSNFSVASCCYRLLSKSPINKLRMIGILHRLGLLNKIWLSPELNNSAEMIALIRNSVKRRYRFINLMFHSTSLSDNSGSFLQNRKELGRRLTKVFEFCCTAGIRSISLSECLDHLNLQE